MAKYPGEYRVAVTTTGSPGSATGTGDTPPLFGFVDSITLDYHASAPATTTVDIDEVGGGARKILDKAASATDVTHRPRAQGQDTTGADIAGFYDRIALVGRPLRVTVAASNALTDAIVATIVVIPYDL
jgi:hypothetical protein